MSKIFLTYNQQIFKNPTTKKYKDGTKFEDIVELYYFDESLRQLFLRYLIKVENEIKSQVSYYFTEKHGENQKEYSAERHTICQRKK